MAIRNIVKSGSETLRKKSKPVKDFDEKLWELLDDMRETMEHADGVGLAAVQVGVLRRAIVLDVNNMKIELINPEIIKKSGHQYTVEGCLSVDSVQGYCDRPEFVTVRAMDRYGYEFTLSGESLLAKAICHECDHLDGILFTDIMKERYVSKKEK